MKDFRLTVSVRNNRLLSMIEDQYGSQAEMARKTGIRATDINKLVTMRETPVCNSGWRGVAEDIATALGAYPSDIWPDHMKDVRLLTRSADVEISAEEVAQIAGAEDKSAEYFALIARSTSSLTERQKTFLAWLMTDGMNATLDEKGAFLGVSRERARQIEDKTFRKMRDAMRIKHGIRNYLEAAE